MFGTTANFGHLSGALKHFLDTTYYETRETIAGRPFGYWIHGGHDTTGADQALRAITRRYGLRLAAASLVLTGDADFPHLEAAASLGATLAVGLLAVE